MADEFEKWWSRGWRGQSDHDTANLAWNTALATQWQPQGDTCKTEPKHRNSSLRSRPQSFVDGYDCDGGDYCIECHHAQALAAKEAELERVCVERSSIEKLFHDKSMDYRKELAAAQSSIAQLEAVVEAADWLVATVNETCNESAVWPERISRELERYHAAKSVSAQRERKDDRRQP